MDRIERLDRVIRDWLDDTETTIVCGRWADGSVGELLPRGRAKLSSPGHAGRFVGVRDLWIEGEEHHLHLDLGTFDRVVYAVVPSVCFGWRPSLELHFQREQRPTGLAFATSTPYALDRIRRPLVERYFRRLVEHERTHSDLVTFASEAPRQKASSQANEHTYRALSEVLWQLGGRTDDPPFDPADPAGSLSRIHQEIRA